MKYIDAEKLIAEIDRRMKELEEQIVDIYDSKAVLRKDELQKLLSFIASFQQEQDRIMKDYPYMPGWRLNKENNKPAIKHSILMLTTHGVAEGEWNGNEWIQYRWSCKVKDSDVLYWIHLEDLTQLEKERQPLQQEQPEVDLAEELGRWRHNNFKGKCDGDYVGEYYVGQYLERGSQLDLARHFYELGQRTKYQQDREEFAKLKAKEWQEGYDEGYTKGLNSRKEDAK